MRVPTTRFRVLLFMMLLAVSVTAIGAGSLTASAASEPLCPSSPPTSNYAVKLFWNSYRVDNYTAVSQAGTDSAVSAGYSCVRVEGYAYPSFRPGVVPLYLYSRWSGSHVDNFTGSTQQAATDAYNAGYTRVRIEGYVYPTAQPNSVPLKLYYSASRNDNDTIATPQGEQAAIAAGYQFVRVEGYVSQFPTTFDIHLDSNLGSDHYMTTNGTLDMSTGLLTASTRTYSLSWWSGFHGAVRIVFEDANGNAIAATNTYRYGVDGTAFGVSDITAVWQESVPPSVAGATVRIHVFQFWAPNNLQTMIDNAVSTLEPITKLIQDFKAAGGSAH